jgi:dienelactone hydrolase
VFRHHGWAAARGDLSNEENKKEYEDVYSRVAAFFKSVQKA